MRKRETRDGNFGKETFSVCSVEWIMDHVGKNSPARSIYHKERLSIVAL
jgi:hypothetical protein